MAAENLNNVVKSRTDLAIAKMDVKDPLTVAVLVTFLVQKKGAILEPELKELLKAKGAHIHGATLRTVLQGLKKRTILAQNQAESEDGTVVNRWEIRKLNVFPNDIEVAHVSDLIPHLLKTPGAAELKAAIEGDESKGESKKRSNAYRGYLSYVVTCQLMDPVYGSQIMNPEFKQTRMDHRIKDITDKDKIFERDALTGDIVFRADMMQGWISSNMCRLAEISDAAAKMVYVSPVTFPKKTPVYQTILPVVDNKRGGVSAPVSYETIRAGTFFEFRIKVPQFGFGTAEQVEKLMHICGRAPRKGMSPARGSRSGRFRVVGFRNEGDVNRAPLNLLEGISLALLKKAGLEPDEDSELPQELTVAHVKYLMDAEARLAKVDVKDKKAAAYSADDESDDDADDSTENLRSAVTTC